MSESNWSNRQIAAVAGVSEATVRRTSSNDEVERPAKILGADGKWRDLAHYAAACIDQALDSSPHEADAILVECITVLDGAIDELDRPGRAA